MDDFNNPENSRTKLETKNVLIILGCSIIIGVVLVGILFSNGERDYTALDVRNYTERCLKETVLYPSTFKLKSISLYESEKEDSQGYKTFRTVGVFSAESKIGLKINQDYIVYLKYNASTRDCQKISVYVDGNLY